MTTCEDVLNFNTELDVRNLDSKLIYLIQKNKLKFLWNKAIAEKPGKLQTFKQQVNDAFEQGYYVSGFYTLNDFLTESVIRSVISDASIIFSLAFTQTFFKNHIVDLFGDLKTCPAQGLGIYCNDLNSNFDGNNAVEKRCCACGRNKSCASHVWPAWCGEVESQSTCFTRLRQNLFHVEINRLITEKINQLDDEIAKIKEHYDGLLEPLSDDSMDVGCCQSLEFNDISANNIIFDLSNPQNCTVRDVI